jgi:hypothetical protein
MRFVARKKSKQFVTLATLAMPQFCALCASHCGIEILTGVDSRDAAFLCGLCGKLIKQALCSPLLKLPLVSCAVFLFSG